MNVDYTVKQRQGDISNDFTRKKISRESAGDKQECESSQAEGSQAANTGQRLQGQTAFMDLQVKMQVLGKCFKMCNVVFCTILQLFSE